MSRLFKTVKRYYDKGIYDEADVAVFVRAGSITPEEYAIITGEPYESEAQRMTQANYISIAALLVSCIMAFVNIKNGKLSNKRADSAADEQRSQRAREEQAKDTQVMLTLNNIEKQLNKIDGAIDTVRQDTRDNHDKLLIALESQKSMHKRIDEHEQRINDLEQALRK